MVADVPYVLANQFARVIQFVLQAVDPTAVQNADVIRYVIRDAILIRRADVIL